MARENTDLNRGKCALLLTFVIKELNKSQPPGNSGNLVTVIR